MALQGDIKFTKTIEHPDGETEIVQMKVSEDVKEDDPHYEQRGTVIEKEQKKWIQVIDEDKSFEDVYLVINSCGFTQHKMSDGNKLWYISIIYHVYLSEEERNLNPGRPEQINDWTDMELLDITSDEFLNTDIVTYAYNTLLKKYPFSDMVSV